MSTLFDTKNILNEISCCEKDLFEGKNNIIKSFEEIIITYHVQPFSNFMNLNMARDAKWAELHLLIWTK